MKTRQQLEDDGYSPSYIEGYFDGAKDEAERTAPIQRWEVREPAGAPSKRWACEYHGLQECFTCHPLVRS